MDKDTHMRFQWLLEKAKIIDKYKKRSLTNLQQPLTGIQILNKDMRVEWIIETATLFIKVKSCFKKS